MGRRRGLLTRLCAVCLLVLATSPLTAPFSTLDLATLSGHVSPHDTGKLNTKPSNDGPSLPVARTTVLITLERRTRGPAIPPNLLHRLQAERGVLRI